MIDEDENSTKERRRGGPLVSVALSQRRGQVRSTAIITYWYPRMQMKTKNLAGLRKRSRNFRDSTVGSREQRVVQKITEGPTE